MRTKEATIKHNRARHKHELKRKRRRRDDRLSEHNKDVRYANKLKSWKESKKGVPVEKKS